MLGHLTFPGAYGVYSRNHCYFLLTIKKGATLGVRILGVQYEEFEEPEIISLDSITGTFAMEDIELSYGHYWVTVAMDRVHLIVGI